MKRRGSLGIKVGAGMFTLGLLAASCVAPERDFGASSTGTGGGTSSSRSGAGGMMSASSASASSSSGSGTNDGCTGDMDKSILADMMAIFMVAQACGQMCLGDANRSACAASCMQMNAKLSIGCSQCWGDYIACAIDHCLPPCAQLGSQQCQDCTVMNCGPAYQLCSGL